MNDLSFHSIDSARVSLARGRGERGTKRGVSLVNAIAMRAVAAALGVVMLAGELMATPRDMPGSFADLADSLLPSVVNISTTQNIEGQPGIEAPIVPPGSPFEEFFKEFFERGQPRRQSRPATSLGSGFIVDPSGIVVTNNHVIQDADSISVILPDETRLDATVLGRDAKTDIAVLKVEAPVDLPAVTFGDSDEMRVGDWVVAIGNPFGFGGTVTAGIISARGRDIRAGPYDDFLQTDASINRGNSGGPMFNMDGQVIGINTAIFSPSGGSIGIGFAIPSNSAKPVIDQLVEHGEVKRGWFGVRIQAVTDEIAETLGLDKPHGALVASVIEGGPADEAGVKNGDIILEFAGKDVHEMRELPRIVAETDVGSTVDVELWRDGKIVTTRVTVGSLDEGEEQMMAESESPKGSEGSASIEALGLNLAAIDDRLRSQFELSKDAKGVVVTQVDPNGPAAEKGVREGDLIVEVSQEEVSSPSEVLAKIEAAEKAGRRSVLMLIDGEGGLRFVAVRFKEE